MYLKIDVLLSPVVFEVFRIESINSFVLDPGHYLSTPGCNWDVILRFTVINFKLISDIRKHQSIESVIGGVFEWFLRVIVKLTVNSENHKTISKTKYWDANSLYGHSMMELPIAILGSINPWKIKYDNYRDDRPIESDLDYPNKLHDLHNNYLLVSEKVKGTK